MIKTFKYKGVEVDVEFSTIKSGLAFFGDVEPQDILEASMKQIAYDNTENLTPESLCVDLWSRLVQNGVTKKIIEIRYKYIKFKGDNFVIQI
jgi:hypothetical protein